MRHTSCQLPPPQHCVHCVSGSSGPGQLGDWVCAGGRPAAPQRRSVGRLVCASAFVYICLRQRGRFSRRFHDFLLRVNTVPLKTMRERAFLSFIRAFHEDGNGAEEAAY